MKSPGSVAGLHALALEPRTLLGEAPLWVGDRLYWVDIRRGRVWCRSAGGAPQCILTVSPPVSAAIPTQDGNLLLTGKSALLVANLQTQQVSELARLPDEPDGNRCNEARTDPWGNLWIGTMNQRYDSATGSLWRLSRDGELRRVLRGVTIANTLAWDVRRERLYFGDSVRGEIHAFDVDEDSPKLRDQRGFLAREAAPGVPDGSALDVDGNLWNARWDGGCVICVSPEGAVEDRLEVPALRPTSCAFGAGTELWITTALPDDGQPQREHDGHLLQATTPRGGAPSVAYAGPTRAADIRIGDVDSAPAWRD